MCASLVRRLLAGYRGGFGDGRYSAPGQRPYVLPASTATKTPLASDTHAGRGMLPSNERSVRAQIRPEHGVDGKDTPRRARLGGEEIHRDDHAESFATLRELISPEMPAHVREKAARALAGLAERKPEPEPQVERCGVNLAELIAIAINSGVDIGELGREVSAAAGRFSQPPPRPANPPVS
jgi:hypothetical protein